MNGRQQLSRGYTLIEMLVALGLGGLVLAGLVLLFTSVASTYRLDLALVQVQDNARFAYNLMGRDIRSAGYQGCIDTDQVETQVLGDDAPTALITANAIQGYEVGTSTWSPAIDPAIADLDGIAKAGSDVVTLHVVEDANQPLTATMSSTVAPVRLADNSLGFSSDDLLLITDCQAADLFQVSNIDDSSTPVVVDHASTANSTGALSRAYDLTAAVGRYHANTYYVAANGLNNAAGNPVFSLYRRDVSGDDIEIVEGVNSMQLLYGEQVSPGQIRYVAASNVGLDFSRVVSVRLGLLMQDSRAALSDNDDKIYLLPGDTVSPVGTSGATQTYAVDATMKQVFATTFTLRNRL